VRANYESETPAHQVSVKYVRKILDKTATYNLDSDAASSVAGRCMSEAGKDQADRNILFACMGFKGADGSVRQEVLVSPSKRAFLVSTGPASSAPLHRDFCPEFWVPEQPADHEYSFNFHVGSFARDDDVFIVLQTPRQRMEYIHHARQQGASFTVLIDDTFNTNRQGFKLLNIMVRTQYNSILPVAHALVSSVSLFTVSMALAVVAFCSGGFVPHHVISDGDTALASAVEQAFPRANHFLCHWHLRKNIFSHTRKARNADGARKSVLYTDLTKLLFANL
jgi:hypothetical protein